ncbi:rhodanese-like domain-containing protein [Rhodothermus profundi]|uniref:Rhodanese-related sulfurtransferase n=1 Tax=Rhodothermus profundi TaxID=633813 RepID=A0A1M6RMY8_9BACT|nr:rhodanese-like domain-containing protein [Rhodothermus profundi]SHK33881.1 Rhodanese-related sulfurtransferase [Rhodothermus profundi]
MRLLLLLLLLLPGLQACTPQRASTQSAPATEQANPAVIVRLSAEEFLARYTPEAVILDVRTPEEFAQGHLKGARNVNVLAADFRERIQALNLDPNAPVYLYCRSGRRSQRAAEILRDMGFRKLYNIGGFNDLARAGAAVE